METTTVLDPIQVQVSVKRPKRFKAGAELSGAVNLVSVDIIETEEAATDRFELRMVVETTYREIAQDDGTDKT